MVRKRGIFTPHVLRTADSINRSDDTYKMIRLQKFRRLKSLKKRYVFNEYVIVRLVRVRIIVITFNRSLKIKKKSLLKRHVFPHNRRRVLFNRVIDRFNP